MSVLLRVTSAGPVVAPRDARVFAPLAEWIEAPSDAVLFGAGDDPYVLEGRMASLAAIAVDFPTFKDGRGFSIAHILRTRLGWRGELRAVGDVSRDRLAYMARCGFDAFELREGEDAEASFKAFHEFSVAYQGAATNMTPLFRRRAEALAALAERRAP